VHLNSALKHAILTDMRKSLCLILEKEVESNAKVPQELQFYAFHRAYQPNSAARIETMEK